MCRVDGRFVVVPNEEEWRGFHVARILGVLSSNAAKQRVIEGHTKPCEGRRASERGDEEASTGQRRKMER